MELLYFFWVSMVYPGLGEPISDQIASPVQSTKLDKIIAEASGGPLSLSKQDAPAACTFAGLTMGSGETQDVGGFRKTCTDGKIAIDGCIYEGQFVGLNSQYQRDGSNVAFNCTSQGLNVAGVSYFTHCLYDGHPVPDGAIEFHINRRCMLAENRSTYSWAELEDGEMKYKMVSDFSDYEAENWNPGPYPMDYWAYTNDESIESKGCTFQNVDVAEGATVDTYQYRVTCINGEITITGCLLHDIYVKINGVYQANETNEAFKCIKNETHVSGQMYYWGCMHKNAVVKPNETIENDTFRRRCEVSEGGQTAGMVITHCILKHDKIHGDHVIKLDEEADVDMTEGGRTVTVACKHREYGSTSLVVVNK